MDELERLDHRVEDLEDDYALAGAWCEVCDRPLAPYDSCPACGDELAVEDPGLEV